MEDDLKEEKALKEISVFNLLKQKGVIISLIIGIVLGAVLAFFILPSKNITLSNKNGVVATVNNKKITANDLYLSMKNTYALTFLLENIDDIILSQKYELTDEMQAEIESNAEYYLNSYQSYYGYTKEEFLEANGFENYEAFITVLTLDYRRQLWNEEYLKSLVKEEDINKYYEDKVYGDIDSKHILVKISEDVTDETAKALAEKIIKELNKGTTFDKVVEKYKDSITFEELGFQAYNASLEEPYLTELKNLENNTYSKEPVKTSYGYHIIYRIAQNEKPILEEIKEQIIHELADELGANDETLYYKSLIKLREDNNIKFSDEELKLKYEKYCADINKENE